MKASLALHRLTVCIACLAGTVAHAADPAEKNINSYLVDISGGAVSAGGIVGLDSGITPIETSQDLIVAIQPITSADRKSAFGLAITPAKTTLFPMAGRTYASSPYARLLGNLTLSYAQNKADYAGQTYKKSAYSIDTVYYLALDDDPVYAASTAFKRCADDSGKQEETKLGDLVVLKREGKLTQLQFDEEQAKAADKRASDLNACIDGEMAKVPWNSGRMSVSLGAGRISAVAGNASHSLGQQFNLNAQYPAGPKGLVAVSLRAARRAPDTDTLGQSQLAFKSSRLAAVRYTYGDQVNTDFRVLAEVSNAKSSSASAYRDAFMVALGVDKKLAKGMWLEFRLGRNRANDNGTEQTAGLLSLNVAPTLFAFKK
jgi:hypothetical protein